MPLVRLLEGRLVLCRVVRGKPWFVVWLVRGMVGIVVLSRSFGGIGVCGYGIVVGME